MSITKDQVRAALQVTVAVAETIRDLGQVRSGTLYSNLCSRLSLENYQAIISTLTRAGLIRQDPNHLIVWTGPAKEVSP
jgi:hypothetical protein